MDLKGLEVGLEVKNYKEMCALLCEEEKKGNSRLAQIKEWERYFGFDKKGHKFIVKEIYDIPRDKQDNRSEGNNSIYSDNIQKLIIDLLAQKENDGVVCFSTNQLLRKLEMVNDNYAIGRRNIPKLSELLKVQESIVYDFFDYTHSKLKNALESSLNALQRKSMIIWNSEMTVCIKVAKVEMNSLNEIKIKNGTPCIRVMDDYRPATDDEKKVILMAEQTILKELNCEDKREVLIRKKWNDFRDKVTSIVKEVANIEYYYNSYRIVSNKEYIIEKLGRFEKADTFDELNNIVLEQVDKTIHTKHENAVNKTNVEDDPIAYFKNHIKEIDIVRANENYIEQSKKVSTKVINRKTRRISREKLTSKR